MNLLTKKGWSLAAGWLMMVSLAGAVRPEKVVLKHLEQEHQVEVTIGGKPFTAFCYPEDMEKQVLWPIRSASGKLITRGYPLEPRPYERTDHPHHVGLWFSFGNVNGLDFWNNSFAIPASDKPRYGTIRFKRIEPLKIYKNNLNITATWVDYQETVLMDEYTSYIFKGKGNLRIIERSTQLTARQPVILEENKEGLIGLRVDRSFEEPLQKAEQLLDAHGKLTTVPTMNNEGVNGVYRNAEGLTGGEVWGKRSKWVALRGEKEGEVITIVLYDHPQNINYPAWSHARGYGLFAMNNLAGRAVDPQAEPVKIVLEPDQSITFRYKVVIGGEMSDEEIEREGYRK